MNKHQIASYFKTSSTAAKNSILCLIWPYYIVNSILSILYSIKVYVGTPANGKELPSGKLIFENVCFAIRHLCMILVLVMPRALTRLKITISHTHKFIIKIAVWEKSFKITKSRKLKGVKS